MTTEPLSAQLERLAAEAHPAPWEGHPVRGYAFDEVLAYDEDGERVGVCHDGIGHYKDAPLIVALRNNIPQIIAALKAKEAGDA